MQKKENPKADSIKEIPKEAKVKSLYKAIQILLYFTEEVKELGVTELAEKSGLLKSTVSNIMSTYEVCGIVEQNPKTNKYKLGLKVLELSNRFYYNDDIRKIMRPYMEKIAEKVKETVYLAVFYGEEIIYLDAAFPGYSIGTRNMTGVKAPAYCTGIGKALLAYEKEEVVDVIISKGLEPFTQNTITEAEALKKELIGIREQGYAVDNMEHEFGIRCVAVPIKNYEGVVRAAISVSGPSLRFQDERIEELAILLQQTTEAVSWQLR